MALITTLLRANLDKGLTQKKTGKTLAFMFTLKEKINL